MEAYIGGVSTRKVDSLVAALGSQSGISKSQVSRICQDIDQQVQAFLGRSLESSSYAYVYLDATYLKGRLGKAQQVCSRAVVVAMGVNEDGRRELLGNSCGEGFAYKVGNSESEPFWARADSKSHHWFGCGCCSTISSNAVMSCITACMPARIDRNPARRSRLRAAVRSVAIAPAPLPR
jgi:hypothetical protein